MHNKMILIDEMLFRQIMEQMAEHHQRQYRVVMGPAKTSRELDADWFYTPTVYMTDTKIEPKVTYAED